MCSGTHHNVRRGRSFGGNDRRDVAMTLTVISTCKRVTKSGLRGVRVGEAGNFKDVRFYPILNFGLFRASLPGHPFDHPKTTAKTTDCPPLGPEVFAMSDHEDSMEDDPTTSVNQPLATIFGGRRLVLLPQSSGRTPRSVCDRSSTDEGTDPFRGQLDVRSPVVSHNRFAPAAKRQQMPRS